MSAHTVTVVTRTKDRTLLLRRALESVQKQTFANYIHVVVNDGGEPHAVDRLVEEFNDPRICVLHNPTSLGMEGASNRGLNAFPAEYAVIHDDDDSWESVFLEVTHGYLKNHPEMAGVVTNITQRFESVGQNAVQPLRSRPFNPAVKEFRLDDFLVVNQFVPIGFVYRYALHQEIGFFDQSLPVCGDLDFHLRVLHRHKIGKLSDYLASYHIRCESKNSAMNNSVTQSAKHQKYAAELIAKYDQRTVWRRWMSVLRVKGYYRVMNVLMRLGYKLGIGR
ncbi:glycosyltransferase family 2 protein [Vibrio sp. WXL210]|uniref:glycosyltransferase family 2 protein n=1 Tax=Vibrio sp. WXL210 TaxID=3450709 RepID=UPI003EC8D1BE